tara:strand:+ start:249 stop:1067 length:819 start_codon:yes stop_codon:yes gene_type:complete
MKKLKYKIENITRKEIKDLNYLKQSIFEGNIFIFKKLSNSLELVNLIDSYFYQYFGVNIEDFITEENPKNFQKNKISDFQEKIKNSKILLDVFSNLLKDLKFNIQHTFSDKITFRYSPAFKKKPLGMLKPSKAHRDTWASNVFNQINWWVPLHKVNKSNSIFIVPDYFKKKVTNNSDSWSFEKFKNIKDYPSTPFSEAHFREKLIKRFELDPGDVLCFSGNHIHGSILGEKKRINIETRTICYNDEEKYNIPKNIDSHTKEKKINWFSPLKK